MKLVFFHFIPAAEYVLFIMNCHCMTGHYIKKVMFWETCMQKEGYASTKYVFNLCFGVFDRKL